MDDVEAILSLPGDRKDADVGYEVWDVDLDSNLAQIERLNLSDVVIKMQPEGERLTLIRGTITVEFEHRGDVIQIELTQPGHCIFLPGDTEVTFTTKPNTLAINEMINVAPKNGLRKQTHLFPLAKYLKPGDHISGSMSIEPETYGVTENVPLYLYGISNIEFQKDDRVLLAIPGKSQELVYIGNNPLEIEVLSGHGQLNVWDLNVRFSRTRSLKPGDKDHVPSNVAYQFISDGDKPFVIRDTCKGFDPATEFPLTHYFEMVSSAEKNALLDLMFSQGLGPSRPLSLKFTGR